MEENDIQLRTEEVNELLGAEPNWVYRWGILTIFVIMLLGLVLSFFIRYPDILTAKTTITTLNPPVTLVSKTDGKIISLLAKNNQRVKEHDLMMVLENTTNYKDVLFLSALVAKCKVQFSVPNYSAKPISIGNLELGTLTSKALQFVKSHQDYKLFKEINPQEKEIAIINRELIVYRALFQKYQIQENIAEQELGFMQKDFDRSSSLFKDGVISSKEYEDKHRELLNVRRSFENIKINTLNNKITLNNLEKTKLQLQIQAHQQHDQYFQALTQAISELQSAISVWQETYLIKSPIEGNVSLYNYWAINQHVKQGEVLMVVVPNKKQAMLAKLILPIQNSGKLKEGQLVNIKLDNYPYQEYGYVKGIVSQIATMPSNNTYSIEVQLPENLTTSYKKELVYKEEMQGTAEIITEELSVFDRIFYQFRKLLK